MAALPLIPRPAAFLALLLLAGSVSPGRCEVEPPDDTGESAAVEALREAGPRQPEPTRDVELRFVTPSLEGTVSLGVFDPSGRLVRQVAEEATMNEFRVGLNGLSTTWDGLDAAGRPAPGGTYSARGYVLGEVSVEGEAYFFNDWMSESDSPPIERVAAQQLLPGGDLLLAVRLAGGQGALLRHAPDKQNRWQTVVQRSRPEPASLPVSLSSDGNLAVVELDGSLGLVDLQDGRVTEGPAGVQDIRRVAAGEGRVAAVRDGSLLLFRLPDLAPLGPAPQAPGRVVDVAVVPGGLLAALDNGSVWRLQDGAWTRIDLPEGVRVTDLAVGTGATFWALQVVPGRDTPSVGQYSFAGEFLREWNPSEQEGTPVQLSASAAEDYFVAVTEAPGVQRTVAMRRMGSGAAAAWSVVFDRRIARCPDFGWSNGRLVPDGGTAPAAWTVPLAPNDLDPAAPREITLSAGHDAAGSFLATAEGLVLLRISDAPGIARVMIVPGPQSGEAVFYQGDGAGVASFRIRGMDRLTSFDAGDFVLPPAGGGQP